MGTLMASVALSACRTQQATSEVGDNITTTSSTGSSVTVASADAAPSASGAADAGQDAASVATSSSGDPCAAIVARSNRVRAAIPSDTRASETLASFGRCQRTSRGLWAIVLNELRVDPQSEGTFNGSWAIVHVDAAGHEVSVPHNDSWQDMARPELTTFALFDYDGDGEQELVWSVHTNVSEGADGHAGGVMTFKQGAISALQGTAEIAPYAAEDVDNDGRLDLMVRAPYVGDGDDSPSGFTYTMQGPALVLHSLANGTFSRDDAVAQQYARRACAARVATVFPASGEFEATVAVACARLWGVGASAVRGAISRRCQTVAESESGRQTRHVSCGDVRVLNRWADAPAPLTLR
ncbi:MAG: VCBS repeat-containing protein [Polyangiales bacterium]